MTQWQPPQYDPRQHQRRIYGQQYPPQPPAPPVPASMMAPFTFDDTTEDGPANHPPARAPRKTTLTAMEGFWYVLGCIPLGAAYFAKIPAKKALADFGLAELTAMEGFWYVLMCIAFGGGYFAKISTAKALSEMTQFRAARR